MVSKEYNIRPKLVSTKPTTTDTLYAFVQLSNNKEKGFEMLKLITLQLGWLWCVFFLLPTSFSGGVQAFQKKEH
jgi:hypothetical protein